MIVTQKLADEAAGVLGLAVPYNEADVSRAYRERAKEAHPDGGGSAEAFAAVDRAKHILLKWLARAEEPQTPGAGQKCPRCGGAGHIVSQRAWKAMRVQCPRCRGAGCLDAEHEKGDHR